MTKYLPIVSIILIGIAIVLGYLIFQQQRPDSPKETGSQVSTREYPSYTSSDDILIFPDKDAPSDVRRLHSELAQSIAQEGSVLEIGGDCVANPVVLQIQQGATLKVQNTDTIQHELVVSQEYIYLIEAGQSEDLIVDFGKGPGLYGYGCDQNNISVGVFLITE